MSDRLCLTADLMGSCPVWGLEQRLITAERVRQQRDNAMAQVDRLNAEVERLTADAAEYNRGLAGLTSVVEATTLQTDRLLARARAADARVAELEQALADCIKTRDMGWEAAAKFKVETEQERALSDGLAAQYKAARAEVERLRGMIRYALAGSDKDLPEPLGGWAVEGVKKVLRDALGADRE